MNDIPTEHTGTFKRIPNVEEIDPNRIDDLNDDDHAEESRQRRDWDPYQVWRSRIRRS